MHYVDGFVVPVPTENLEAYREIADKTGKIWMEHGALAYVEAVAEDNEDKGFCATFPQAFNAKEGETLVFAYILYTSRAQRDEVNAKVMADERLQCNDQAMPFDCKRMAYGGFQSIVQY